MRLRIALAASLSLLACTLPSHSQAKTCLGFTQFVIDDNEPDLANSRNIGQFIVCAKNPDIDIIEGFFGKDDRFEMYQVRN